MFNSQKPLQIKFFFTLLLAVGALTFFIMAPYLLTLAVAAAFAVVLQPLYNALHRICRGYGSIASLVTILITIILILAPLSLIVGQIAKQATQLYQEITAGNNPMLFTFLGQVESAIESFFPQFELDVTQYAGQLITLLTSNLGTVFAGTFQTAVHFILAFVALYYFLKDGPKFVQAAVMLSPLSNANDEILARKMRLSINSIIKGNLLIALIQGLVSGIGMAIFGIPNATLWGSLAGFAALIPSLGTSVVLIPAIVYLFLIDRSVAAVGMLIWAATAVGMIDNLLGPILIGRGVHIHPLWILFAVIGGISLFGPLGVLAGPLVLSLFYALLSMYKELFIEEKGRL